MLYVDLTASDDVLCAIVTRLCEEYGTVHRIAVHRSAPFHVMVAMSTHFDSIRVCRHLGGSLIGRFISFTLKHKAVGPSTNELDTTMEEIALLDSSLAVRPATP
jgi:hypothetical protein